MIVIPGRPKAGTRNAFSNREMRAHDPDNRYAISGMTVRAENALSNDSDSARFRPDFGGPARPPGW
jgi:hypothetical protein